MAAAATWVQKNFMDFCHNYFWWCWASFIVHGCKKRKLEDMTGKLSVKSWLPHPIQTTGICGCLCGECHSAVKAFANMSSRFDQLQWNLIGLSLNVQGLATNRAGSGSSRRDKEWLIPIKLWELTSFLFISHSKDFPLQCGVWPIG